MILTIHLTNNRKLDWALLNINTNINISTLLISVQILISALMVMQKKNEDYLTIYVAFYVTVSKE